ncbi:MAG: glycosyl transferase [Pseudomonadota bacterium]|jgi:UDP-N-acetylmuramyl pentapeptide phosphotransferase/UDP-N-acetylglucosamine-1-phosphate transferase|nr:glycosyl transferase [Pseudomonadota bacterium]
MDPLTRLAVWSAAAAILCAALLWLMRATGFMMHVLDRPNARSMHSRPIPRVGGLPLLFAGWGLATLAAPDGPALALAFSLPLACLMLIGGLDDRIGLAALPRMLAQFACAAPLAASWSMRLVEQAPSGPAFALAGLLSVLAILAVAWAINLYNFMDGSDALAGLMTVIGFGALALAVPSEAIGLTAACIAGAAAGFLVHNRPPARVFLGDLGSTALGFLAAALAFEGMVAGHWPFWFPGIVFMPFWLDATLTLLRRALAGKRLSEAHRDHAYQRLALAGAGHAGTAIAYGLLMLADAAAALSLLRHAAAFPIYEIAGIIMVHLLAYVVIQAFPTPRAD